MNWCTIIEIKNLADEFNRRLNTAAEKISDLKESSGENIETKGRRSKRFENIGKNVRDRWNM